MFLFGRGRGICFAGLAWLMFRCASGSRSFLVEVQLQGSPVGLSQIFVRAVVAGKKLF